jgi:hypothetical protein
MKFLVILSLTFVAAFAASDLEVDWSNVLPIQQILKEHLANGMETRLHSAYAVPDRRIVNGELATPGQFPYQVRN